MPKKLTTGFVEKSFKKEGYILLTKKYINANQKLDYVCPKRHKGSICWTDWYKGHRCAECAGNKRHTIGFIRKHFEREGYTLLSSKYTNAFQKLEYICPKGHYGTVCWNNWYEGKRCRVCSYIEYGKKQKGENNHRWNFDLTDEDRLDRRKYQEYYVWRGAVYKRDDYTCYVCKNSNVRLVAHHLASYMDNPLLRVALDNGVTLCRECHKNFHKHYGYGSNTKEQFEEFRISVVNLAYLLHICNQ